MHSPSITESWLSDRVSDQCKAIPIYQLYRKGRDRHHTLREHFNFSSYSVSIGKNATFLVKRLCPLLFFNCIDISIFYSLWLKYDIQCAVNHNEIYFLEILLQFMIHRWGYLVSWHWVFSYSPAVGLFSSGFRFWYLIAWFHVSALRWIWFILSPVCHLRYTEGIFFDMILDFNRNRHIFSCLRFGFSTFNEVTFSQYWQ